MTGARASPHREGEPESSRLNQERLAPITRLTFSCRKHRKIEDAEHKSSKRRQRKHRGMNFLWKQWNYARLSLRFMCPQRRADLKTHSLALKGGITLNYRGGEGGICCLPDVKGGRKPSTEDGVVFLLSDGTNIESLQGD